jgi:flagellar biosynthesis GTPase FlhF
MAEAQAAAAAAETARVAEAARVARQIAEAQAAETARLAEAGRVSRQIAEAQAAETARIAAESARVARQIAEARAAETARVAEAQAAARQIAEAQAQAQAAMSSIPTQRSSTQTTNLPSGSPLDSSANAFFNFMSSSLFDKLFRNSENPGPYTYLQLRNFFNAFDVAIKKYNFNNPTNLTQIFSLSAYTVSWFIINGTQFMTTPQASNFIQLSDTQISKLITGTNAPQIQNILSLELEQIKTTLDNLDNAKIIVLSSLTPVNINKIITLSIDKQKSVLNLSANDLNNILNIPTSYNSAIYIMNNPGSKTIITIIDKIKAIPIISNDTDICNRNLIKCNADLNISANELVQCNFIKSFAQIDSDKCDKFVSDMSKIN